MNEMSVLLMSAATLGVIHTLLGPDHYVPFIVFSRSRKWPRSRTLWITFASGVGHVAGSTVLGLVGIAMGIGLGRLEAIEAIRGNVVGWVLIAFGILYTAYGVHTYRHRGAHGHLPAFLRPRSIRRSNLHLSSDDLNKKEAAGRITPWILFLIFVFGPCEVLIPMLVYPAAEQSGLGIFLIVLVFGTATVGSMLLAVMLGCRGFSMVRFNGQKHQLRLIEGLVILGAGAGMQFLGL